MEVREQAQQSFGEWLRQHRRALDLTQEELARQVGCSAITLRKLEAEERRPSKQIAERLADLLKVAPDDRPAFLRFARGDPFAGPADAKAPDKPEPPKHNLPLQLTSFIGREKEIGQIRRQLARARLLTLTGAGGSGKTRLALEVAGGLLPQYPDGTWLVELASLAEPALLPQAVANTLGLREMPGVSITAVLLDYLRPRQILLLLDNCEHLIQACAELVEKMLSACPGLKVLATSREGLSIAGERTYLVPALSLPGAAQTRPVEMLAQSEAVRVFVERAGEALPGFELTDENALAVAQVCRQLDGIPLALELAAVRVKVLSVEQIVARLDDRFRLLSRGSRTAEQRHQTLQALLDWSYELLTPAEQTLLRRLAVFMGGWTLEAAEAVGAGEADTAGGVLDRLGRLVDKSLVQVVMLATAGGPLYHFLETIRQYALAKLAVSGEADAVKRRHAAYFLRVWQKNEAQHIMHGIPQPAWINLKDMELANLAAALSWSLSPAGDVELGLRLSAVIPAGLIGYAVSHAWMEQAMSRAEAEPEKYPHARAMALLVLGELDVAPGNYASAQANLTQSLLLLRESGSRPEIAMALGRLGWLARERGDAATARRWLGESLALYRELGDKGGIAAILTELGDVAVMQENSAEAAGLLQEALALNRALEHQGGAGWALNHLGHVARLEGRYAAARQLYEESRQLFFVPGDEMTFGVGFADYCLGESALDQGDAALARRKYREALDVFRFQGTQMQAAWCLAGLAGVAMLDEEPERAARLWGAAAALSRSIGGREAAAARATQERLMAAAREELGEAAFAAAWAEGEKLTTEQAIALALEAE